MTNSSASSAPRAASPIRKRLRPRVRRLPRVYAAGFRELQSQVGFYTHKPASAKTKKPAGGHRQYASGLRGYVRRVEKGMSWLATTGSVAPFVGLFGTVWGIIDAFSGLGNAGAASLRAVAPGISEALLTTAAGLATAIPAVIFYNQFLAKY